MKKMIPDTWFWIDLGITMGLVLVAGYVVGENSEYLRNRYFPKGAKQKILELMRCDK